MCHIAQILVLHAQNPEFVPDPTTENVAVSASTAVAPALVDVRYALIDIVLNHVLDDIALGLVHVPTLVNAGVQYLGRITDIRQHVSEGAKMKIQLFY